MCGWVGGWVWYVWWACVGGCIVGVVGCGVCMCVLKLQFLFSCVVSPCASCMLVLREHERGLG